MIDACGHLCLDLFYHMAASSGCDPPGAYIGPNAPCSTAQSDKSIVSASTSPPKSKTIAMGGAGGVQATPTSTHSIAAGGAGDVGPAPSLSKH